MNDERRPVSVADEPLTLPPVPSARCQVCGAAHAIDDPILCRECGEPVLRWGWAP